MESVDYTNKKIELENIVCELETIANKSIKDVDIYEFITDILKDNDLHNDVVCKVIHLSGKANKLIREINELRFNQFVKDISYIKKKSLVINAINNMSYTELQRIYNYLCDNNIISE